MARQAGNVIENKFIKGLITETTVLNFPTDASTETWNCVFDETGLVTRRLGIDLEETAGEDDRYSTGLYDNTAFTEYVWSYVGSSSDKAFLVQQTGHIIRFYDIGNNTVPSTAATPFVINLKNYSESTVEGNIAYRNCQYAQGRGHLFIINPSSRPLYVSYNVNTNNIVVEDYLIKYRDFEGVPDGLAINARPGGTYNDLRGTNPAHCYNLFNQGWGRTDGGNTVIQSWDDDRSDLPSNADVVGYFRSSTSDTFNPELIDQHDAGNSPAPKGHFILTVGLDEREFVAGVDGAGVINLGDTPTSPISTVGKATFGNIPSAWAVFDENEGTNTGTFYASSNDYYAGVDLGVAGATPILSATFSINHNDDNGPAQAYAQLYVSNTFPANATNGTLIDTSPVWSIKKYGDYTAVFNNTVDTVTAYRYYWFRVVQSNGPNKYIAYHSSAITGTVDDATIFPATIAFMGGRLFYSGYSDEKISGNIYFTQILESEMQYGNCYQMNDPASDEIADLLATDGGVIKIPEIGKVHKLTAFQNQLLILASNGVWLVKGGNGGGPFAATGYSVSKISSVSCYSPLSVVDIKGLPIWWAEDGIYTVTYDANYDSTTLQTVTEDSIKTFLTDIPPYNRKFVKGTYDRINDVAYWIFNDTSTMTEDGGEYTYTKALCLNIKSKAFYPWQFNIALDTHFIQGIQYVESATRSAIPGVKFTTTYGYTDPNTTKLTYSQAWKDTYKDWADYAVLVATPTEEQDYSSYFVAGYRLDGEGAKFFQGNYIYTFMEKEANASLLVRGRYQFSSSGLSGKWSMAQQAYNGKTSLGRDWMDTKVSRVKLRGKGQAMQLHYYSETGKPFSCIGWNIFLSVNESI